MPVELLGSVAASPDHRIQVHVTKLSVLKIPLKGVLGGLHISVSALFHPKGIPGIEVSGNDIFFDRLKLLPPPHIHEELTKVRVVTLDIEEVYGNVSASVASVSPNSFTFTTDPGHVLYPATNRKPNLFEPFNSLAAR